MSLRPVKRVVQSKPTVEGAGVKLRRAFGFGDTAETDPFLLLDDFRNDRPQDYLAGFPWHPHRGIETITYVLNGTVEHGDSLGNRGTLGAGDVQWMTAGRGIVHAELSPDEFKRRGGAMEILQLWVNLPARLKFTVPAYTGLQREAIPAIPSPDGRATVNLIAGEWSGRVGPIASLTGVFMSTVELQPGGRVTFGDAGGRNVFLYVVRGSIDIGGAKAPQHHLAELSDAGDEVEIASAQGAVLLFGHADPIGEPVVAHGPFVMNTREEIVQAIRDYEAGRFEPPS